MSGPTQSDEQTRTRHVGPQERVAAAELKPADRFGRFRILACVGTGGMGRVFEAYDEKLDRRVAVKVLRSGRERDEDRLLREAQALARLSDPNVVAVHDVGIQDGRVFVAMEFVKGQTLRSWMRKHPPGAAERFGRALELLIQAGRGLASAHQHGLVHRDFKPANVLVVDEEAAAAGVQAKVVDFGLARPAATEGTSSDLRATGRHEAIGEESGPSRLEDRLTQTGIAIGTPAYMAPEQHRGLEFDHRADVFAFCVTAWELLYGERPYSADDVGSLVKAIDAGNIRSVPGRGVPPWVAPLLRRGLCADPSARFAHLRDLLTALEDGRRRRRSARVWLWAAGGVGVVGAVAGWAWLRDDASRCTGGQSEVEQALDSRKLARIQAALVTDDSAYRQQVWERVEADLSSYAAEWVVEYRQACEATEIRRTQTASMLDLKVACLHERRRALAAASDALTSPNPEVVERAVQVAGSLPDVTRCADASYVLARVKPPDDPAVAAQVEAHRVTLAAARALKDTGQYAAALDTAQQLRTAVGELGYAPLVAEQRELEGAVLASLDRLSDSQDAHSEAYAIARRVDHAEVAAAASLGLLGAMVQRRGDIEDVKRWAAAARADAIATEDPHAVAAVDLNISAACFHAGRFEEALDGIDAVVRDLEAAGVDEPSNLRLIVQGRAQLLERLGRRTEAMEAYAHAQATYEDHFGPDHPEVAWVSVEYGAALWRAGRPGDALKRFERAREIQAAALDPGSPKLANTLNGLGLVLEDLGQAEASEARYRESIASYRQGDNPRHPDLARALGNLAGLLTNLGRADEARPLALEALEIDEAHLPEDHPYRLSSLGATASVLRAAGDVEEAGRLYEQLSRRGLSALKAGRIQALGPVTTSLAGLFESGRAEAACELAKPILIAARKTVGARDPALSGAMRNVALCHERAGQAQVAIAWQLAGVAHLLATAEAGDPSVAEHYVDLSRLAREIGAPESAKVWGERGLAVITREDYGVPFIVALARFTLAQALWESRADRGRALELARLALADYASLRPRTETQHEDVRQWIAARSRTPN